MITLCVNPQCPDPENSSNRDRCQACRAQLVLGERFRPVQLLGQGGFGRTFLAWDESQQPPQACVIKQLLRSGRDRTREWQEAQQLAQLGQHPQIPDLIAVLDSSRDSCLVQTYCPGRNLEQVLTAEGAFTEVQVRSLLGSLLPVLQYIHNHGVIHRDIKPENILLPDSDLPPMLVDFGAAKTQPALSDPGQTGTVIGSAAYAAPEQVMGKAVPASDLYGLGVTCLHLLTEQHPFELYSLAEDRWVWQTFAPHPISPALARVLHRLTARSLRSRYATAEAALADLAPAGLLATPSATVHVPAAICPWTCLRVIATPGRTVNALDVSPDGRAIATANSDGTVQLWDSQTGDLIHTFARRFGFGPGHKDAVTAVRFAAHGQTLFTTSQDGTLKQWNLQTYGLERSLHSSGWPIFALSLAPDDTMAWTGSADGHLTGWELTTATVKVDLVRHTGAINAIAQSPDGTRLASVGEDGTLRLWTAPAGQLLQTWTAKHDNLRAVVISATEPALITGSDKGQIWRWDLMDFQQQQVVGQHQDAVTAIALSPNRQWLATGSRDQEIYVWQWRPSSPRRHSTLRHTWAVHALTFTPDSQILISSAADETIRLWQPTASAL